MLFNSINFILFFVIVYFLYWNVFNKNLKFQNLFLLISSMFFFACWDWRFLVLLNFSILLDFYCGKKIKQNLESIFYKKFWLFLSISINICFLGFFKYFNFFSENFSLLLNSFGFQANKIVLLLILPVGISFYTFHGLSYVIDIYNKKIEPTKDYVDYSLFVSFFPLLVAGPIERATHLLPQIQKKRVFSYENSILGLRQILWGLVKKVVIADNCAVFVNDIYANYSNHSGSTLFVGAILFSFQIYGDFSGYSDIALGVARLLGIELFQNFSYPYFSRNIAEFWRRWHISLSSWFRDYVYIPLGGSKVKKSIQIVNIFVVFLLSGFWHGANWTFLFWGFLNALFFIPLMLKNKNRNDIQIISNSEINLKSILQICFTFLIVTLCWIFFRSNTLNDAFSYLSKIVSPSLFTFPTILPKTTFGFIILFIVIEWFGRNSSFAIKNIHYFSKPFRLIFYYILIFLILYYNGSNLQFIYFQF